MNFSSSFLRKVAYVVAIALLWFPLYMLGQPAVQSPEGPSAGGKLATMRSRYGLSQAELGEIDPASETMKMATLGLRGVATSVLWTKATNYRKTEDWDNLSATLNQVAKLQPNFVSVWEFQGHNLAYNVSAEFDDYRQRYQWVKKGIEFLIDGTRYNSRHPKAHSRLLWNVGWFCGHKIGVTDERVLYRRLFRKDDEFHDLMDQYIDIDLPRGQIRSALGVDGEPDNWRVAYMWLDYSQERDREPVTWLREGIDVEGMTSKRKSTLVFLADAPMALINYSKMVEEEGYFDEKAQRAWREAGIAWRHYGDQPIPSSMGDELRLNDYEREVAEAARFREELDALAPGIRRRIEEEKTAELSQEEREALETPPESRTFEQELLKRSAERRIFVPDDAVAERVAEPSRKEAQRLLERIKRHASTATRIGNYQRIVNYDYWRSRCEVEQTELAVNARKHLFDAKRDFREGLLAKAKDNYEMAWRLWAEIFATRPELMDDVAIDEFVELIKPYRELLGQLDQPFPDDFPLNPLLDRYKVLMSQAAAGPAQASPDGAEAEAAGEARPKQSPPADSQKPPEGDGVSGKGDVSPREGQRRSGDAAENAGETEPTDRAAPAEQKQESDNSPRGE